MKSVLVTLFVLLSSCAFASDKKAPNPADYTITVHVVASYSRTSHSNGLSLPYQRLRATIDGKQVELEGGRLGLLALGDYKARIVPTRYLPKGSSTYEIYLTYEFLFPDGKTAKYEVSGFEPNTIGSPQP